MTIYSILEKLFGRQDASRLDKASIDELRDDKGSVGDDLVEFRLPRNIVG